MSFEAKIHFHMNAVMDRQAKEYGRLSTSNVSMGGDVFEPRMNINGGAEGEECDFRHLLTFLCSLN